MRRRYGRGVPLYVGLLGLHKLYNFVAGEAVRGVDRGWWVMGLALGSVVSNLDDVR